jgi:hypothetical protein
MILVGSQRGGTRQLAAHLLKPENDHVLVHELRGFMATDLTGAMTEAHALAQGTRCRQSVFSLSLNPPKGVNLELDEFVRAADRAEEALGLKGQQRAIVIHEKEGRRHAHVVWSRIDTERMKAINLPHFKLKLNSLSRELFLEHGWELPKGYRTNDWKNPLNFTLDEWQQAKRRDLDPREIKQALNEAWQQSDNLPSFRHALEERGYFLAKGDRRGFVVLDIQGEPLSLSRWLGVKPKQIEARIGSPEKLPGVDEVKADLETRMRERVEKTLNEHREQQTQELQKAKDELKAMTLVQGVERLALERAQTRRWAEETRERTARLRTGLSKVMDILTGEHLRRVRQNEHEAHASLYRDKLQRQTLFDQQMQERTPLQAAIEAIRKRQREERLHLAQQIATTLGIPMPVSGGSAAPGLRHARADELRVTPTPGVKIETAPEIGKTVNPIERPVQESIKPLARKPAERKVEPVLSPLRAEFRSATNPNGRKKKRRARRRRRPRKVITTLQYTIHGTRFKQSSVKARKRGRTRYHQASERMKDIANAAFETMRSYLHAKPIHFRIGGWPK